MRDAFWFFLLFVRFFFFFVFFFFVFFLFFFSKIKKKAWNRILKINFFFSFYNLSSYYTPDIRSMSGYIVFAFPFVRTYVRSFVRLSVTGSKFLR